MTTRSTRTHRYRALVMGVALLLALVFAPAAGAQSFHYYAPITLANVGGSQPADAVACPSSTQCTAVGANGQQVTFDPTTGNAIDSSAVDVLGDVSRVSCPSVSQCTAVDNLGQEVTFNPVSGATLGGGLQTIENPAPTVPPAPPTPSTPLTAVSCPTTSFCVAVDSSGMAYRFNPTMAGSTDGGVTVDTHALNAVTCKSDASACVAVDASGNEVTIDYTGSSPVSAGHLVDSGHSLTGVACRADFGSCTAVDNAGRGMTFDPAVGGSASSPASIDGTLALTAVSCASDYSQCTAVDGQGNETNFVPGAAGTPHSIDAVTPLADVACPAGTQTQCTAVDNQGYELTFNPATGAIATEHSVVPNAMTSVSCPTAQQCTAIEAGSREFTFDPTTQAITGQNGSGTTGPSEIDTLGNRLISVSCPSATQCTAVDQGPYETTFNPQTGRPNAALTSNIETGQSLVSVSCPSVGQCTAVDTRGAEVTFDPRLGGPDGVNPTSPNVIDRTRESLLISVQCSSLHQCVAVDRGGNEITFDPTTGNAPSSSNLAVPTQVDPLGSHPTALSCASATECTAVDDSGRALTFDPTTITTTQNDIAGPTAVDGSTPLTSVSCPAGTACIATDGAANTIQFDPTKITASTVQAVPQAAALAAVSCSAAFECAVVDAAGNAFAGFLPPASTSPPTITGPAQQGQTLTEHHGTYVNYPVSAYGGLQWEDCDRSGCTAIPGATGSTYVPQASDVGYRIAVAETATNLGGTSDPATSAQTSAVLPLPPASQGPPAIVGTVAQGQTLTEQHGPWTGSPSSYTVQWQDCDASGQNCASIPGATGQSYTPQAADVGKTLLVTETATNTGGTGGPAASAVTAPVAPARQADIVAVTQPQSALTWQSAVLHGTVYSQGAPASWQFQYGTTSALGLSTAPQTLAEGNTSEVPSLANLSGLKPATTYYYRLVETVSPDTYRSGVQSLGQVLRFTTPLVGALRLRSAKLLVTGSHATVSLGCTAPINCAARLTLTTVARTGKGRHQHATVVRCATARTVIPHDGAKQLSVALSSACQRLLATGRGHAITTQVTAVSTSGQAGVAQRARLVMPTPVRHRR